MHRQYVISVSLVLLYLVNDLIGSRLNQVHAFDDLVSNISLFDIFTSRSSLLNLCVQCACIYTAKLVVGMIQK